MISQGFYVYMVNIKFGHELSSTFILISRVLHYVKFGYPEKNIHLGAPNSGISTGISQILGFDNGGAQGGWWP